MGGNTLIADIFAKIESTFETNPQYADSDAKLNLLAELADEINEYANELAAGE